jgi:predicted RND superfamily exporter protein
VPIKVFGVYTAIGVLGTLGLLFLFLPAWMQLWPMKPHSLLDGDAPKAEDLALPKRWRAILEGVLDRRRLVFASLALVMVFCGFGLTKINTSIKLTKLFSPHAEILTNYAWLEEKLGPLVPMEIVLSIDNSRCKLTMLERMKLVDRVQNRLREINGIGNTMSAVTFAPSLEVKRAGPFINKRVMAGILNKKLEEHRDEYVDSGFLSVEEDKEMWRISARVGALNDIDYGEFVRDIRKQVEPVLEAERRELLAAAAVAAAKAAGDGKQSLPAPAATPLDNPRRSPTPPLIAAGAPTPAGDDMQGITAIYTGLVPVVYKAQRAMLDGLAWNFITDLLTVAAVISVAFGDLSAGLLLLLPSVFPVVVVFGLMGWMGVMIDVGTIMTPTVALGVSVDDIVHFLIWYRRGLAEGRSRKNAVMLAYEGCARAMYQSWSVLGLGLAVFSLSSFVPTQRFGAMMFCLLTAALLGNLLLMPTTLAGPLAHFFGRRLIRRARSAGLGREDESHELPPPEFADRGMIVPVRRDAPHRSIGA